MSGDLVAWFLFVTFAPVVAIYGVFVWLIEPWIDSKGKKCGTFRELIFGPRSKS